MQRRPESLNDHPEIDIESFRQRLIEKREEITALLEGSEESTRPVELDQQRVGRLSRMDAMQQQAMAQAGERRRRQELERIGQALKRIEEGEYGFCLNCDEPIARARLELDPAATLCIHCAGR